MRTHTNLQLEHRLELYEAGMLPWDLEMTVEEPLSDDEDEDGVPHCVSDSESESENGTFTARARTCGRAVDLPHVRLCRAASLLP